MPKLLTLDDAIREHDWLENFLARGYTVEEENRSDSRSPIEDADCFYLRLEAQLAPAGNRRKAAATAELEVTFWDHEPCMEDPEGNELCRWERDPEVSFAILSKSGRVLDCWRADLLDSMGRYQADQFIYWADSCLLELGMEVQQNAAP